MQPFNWHGIGELLAKLIKIMSMYVLFWLSGYFHLQDSILRISLGENLGSIKGRFDWVVPEHLTKMARLIFFIFLNCCWNFKYGKTCRLRPESVLLRQPCLTNKVLFCSDYALFQVLKRWELSHSTSKQYDVSAMRLGENARLLVEVKELYLSSKPSKLLPSSNPRFRCIDIDGIAHCVLFTSCLRISNAKMVQLRLLAILKERNSTLLHFTFEEIYEKFITRL